MHTNTDFMKACIEKCWECRAECQDVLFNHCLEEGGKHAEAAHVKLMTDCIQICQLSADFMVRNSAMHMATCAACADICDACAVSCEAIGGEEMKNCAKLCRECATSCRSMSQVKKAA